MLLATSIAATACTDVSTDPDAVAALQFDGAGYPSVVVGDSLRDSLGFLLPLSATALNNDGDPIPDADVVYSSPDTVLEMKAGGVVFARGLNPSGAATRVFATVGSLQSQSASLFTTIRADALAPAVEADTSNGQVSAELAFVLSGDTVANAPKMTVPGWLVSFRLNYRGADVSPTDTTVGYITQIVGNRRAVSFIDTTDASGRVGRQVFIRAARQPEDTVFLIATAHRRKIGTVPLTAQIRLILRQGSASSSLVP
jgi:hypothetical protein